MAPGARRRDKGNRLGREDILRRIRAALGDRPLSQADRAALDARMAARPRGPGVRLEGDLQSRFIAKAEANQFTLERVASLQMLVAAVSALLPENAASPDVSIVPGLDHVGWPSSWKINRGAGRPVEFMSVTSALAGIAETGSVVLSSGEGNPTSLNFLPDLHVIVLCAADIVGHPEDAWRLMQSGGTEWPRTVNVISGPSRTADVGGVIVRPAHGPKRVHLIIVDG